jgi:hypothetical protein
MRALLLLATLASATWPVREHGSGSYSYNSYNGNDCYSQVFAACDLPQEQPDDFVDVCVKWRECADEREDLGCADDLAVVLLETLAILPNCARIPPSPPPPTNPPAQPPVSPPDAVPTGLIVGLSVVGGLIVVPTLAYGASRLVRSD